MTAKEKPNIGMPKDGQQRPRKLICKKGRRARKKKLSNEINVQKSNLERWTREQCNIQKNRIEKTDDEKPEADGVRPLQRAERQLRWHWPTTIYIKK